MRREPRGGPGELAARVARVDQLLATGCGAADEPLVALGAVLRHQQRRSGQAAAPAARDDSGRFPLLVLGNAASLIESELALAVDALEGEVPAPLAGAGERLNGLAPSETAAIVETWLDDIALVEPLTGFWVQAAAGPVLEAGAREVSVPAEWSGSACPVCGGPPQASVIAEESGEFMAGSPRSLVCGRCATWWSFPRVTCAVCGQDDSRQIETFFVEARRWARVDTCTTCRGYIKTFDLRERAAVNVVPLVDDVATLSLDVWAREGGYSRSVVSLAGV